MFYTVNTILPILRLTGGCVHADGPLRAADRQYAGHVEFRGMRRPAFGIVHRTSGCSKGGERDRLRLGCGLLNDRGSK